MGSVLLGGRCTLVRLVVVVKRGIEEKQQSKVGWEREMMQ